jgi:hypothetical protein
MIVEWHLHDVEHQLDMFDWVYTNAITSIHNQPTLVCCLSNAVVAPQTVSDHACTSKEQH